MKRIFLIMVVVLCIVPVLSLADDGSEICDHVINTLGFIEGKIISDKLPYKTDVFNAYTLEGEVIGHAKLVDRKITSMGCEETDDPTYRIYVKDIATIDEIRNAESYVSAFDDAISQGSIRIQGVNIGTKTKALFFRAGLKIASWFS
jgi:hypothetical protein